MRSRTVLPALVALAALLLVPVAGSAEQPNRYIVVFKDFAAPEASPLADALAQRFGARSERVFNNPSRDSSSHCRHALRRGSPPTRASRSSRRTSRSRR